MYILEKDCSSLKLKERARHLHQSTEAHFASMLPSCSTDTISGIMDQPPFVNVSSQIGVLGTAPTSSTISLSIEIILRAEYSQVFWVVSGGDAGSDLVICEQGTVDWCYKCFPWEQWHFKASGFIEPIKRTSLIWNHRWYHVCLYSYMYVFFQARCGIHAAHIERSLVIM